MTTSSSWVLWDVVMSVVRFKEAEVHVVFIARRNGVGRWEQVCACARIMDDPLAHH